MAKKREDVRTRIKAKLKAKKAQEEAAARPMTDQDWAATNAARFAEIPKAVKWKAIRAIRKALPDDVRDALVRRIREEGTARWWLRFGGGHFVWGMCARNVIREAGVTDDMFRTGNLDDYYVPIVEAAVGERKASP